MRENKCARQMIGIIKQRRKRDEPNGQEEQPGADRAASQLDSPFGSRSKHLASLPAHGAENLNTSGADFSLCRLNQRLLRYWKIRISGSRPRAVSASMRIRLCIPVLRSASDTAMKAFAKLLLAAATITPP